MHVAQSGYRAMAPEPGRQIPIEGDARSARLIADSEAPRAWAPLRPGIEIRVLQESADGSERIALLRYRPGATVPRHRHLGDEHVYVLEGAQQDEAGRYPAGSYVRNAAGSAHSVSSPEGCLVLIHWTGRLDFAAEAAAQDSDDQQEVST
jgi:anti-sigma factor ChrR (cupin superfamily)